MTRRDQVTDAAIATLAAEGLRGLTHRAVDRAAGLPQGSTSYYFRTRQALLEATVTRLAALDDADLIPPDLLDTPRALSAVVDLAAETVERSTTDHRDRTIARYELSIEATRRPELRAALTAAGERYRRMAAGLLAAAGAADPDRKGRALVAFIDGLIHDRIAGAGGKTLTTAEIRATLAETVAALTGHPSGS